METSNTKRHIGRKIGRIRELRGIKQETLPAELGVSQQTISSIESKEYIESELLQQVAKILGVTSEATENFREEAAINYFNTFHEAVSSSNFGHNNTCTFNPLDKLLEAFEKNRKLYERLVQAEIDKVAYLEEKIMKKQLIG